MVIRKVLAGAGTFHEKTYCYSDLAKSVAEIRSVLPKDVEMDFMLIEGSRPERRDEACRRLLEEFTKADTLLHMLKLEDLPNTDKHWEWSSRQRICYKENYMAKRALDDYDAFLSWEVDVVPPAKEFEKRWPVWAKHAEAGHVVSALMPHNQEGDTKNFLAYNFHPAQLKVDDAVAMEHFVEYTKDGVVVKREPLRIKDKPKIDALVLCTERSKCREYKKYECNGSDRKCVRYVPPQTELEVTTSAAWTIDNPKWVTDNYGNKTLQMTLLSTRPVRDIKTIPTEPDGLIRCHGGHMGFTLIPSKLFEKYAFRYKPHVRHHPDSWFFLDLAKDDIPSYVDPSLEVVHNHREWSGEVTW